MRRWRANNPEALRAQRRRYNAKHREDIRNYQRRKQLNGKIIRGTKRQFYRICELCGEEIEKYPCWHHWDDEHPENGLWLDWLCHQAAEAVEQKGLVIPLYSKLKDLLESQLPR